MRRLLSCVILISALSTALATDYHVSPQGSDANSGLGAGPGDAVRTIQAAVNRAMSGDIVVIHTGTYRETVTFPRNGTADRPITVRASVGADVVVSGCEPTEGWVKHSDTIWKAPMAWTLGLGRNQVFVGREAMIEARHPNEPEGDLGMYVSGLSPLWPTFAELSISEPTKAPGRIVGNALKGHPENHWKGACYYGVHYQGWSSQTGIIESSDDGEITVGDRTKTWWFGPAYGGGYSPEEGRGMIVGHMNALDRPGEWHWEDDTLYLIPKGGGEPQGIEAKARQLAFDFTGREHVRVSGLDIHAASMKMQDSSFCTVKNCRFAYICHFTRHYSIGQIETGRDTIKSGETGIFVGGHDNAFLNCSVRFSAGAGFYVRGYHHTIHNCLIDEVSYTSHYLNAITDAVSDFNDYENFLVGGHVITYNTMRNAGRHFFNIYGNGTSTASRTRGPMDYMATLFAHNHLYNGMLQTKDAGFITGYYGSGGTLDGLNTQIAYNAMHDCYDIFGMRINVLGIVYLDAGSCDVDLHHNLLWAAPGSHQRGLWFNTVCVDINEHDNLFHPNFERTCADLKPADFPERRLFRFGHDFAEPPPLPRWPQLDRRTIRAGACPDRSVGVADSAEGVTGLTDGSWVRIGDIDFDRGWQSAVMEFSSSVKALNSDRGARARPRHRNATDPLVLEAIHNDGTAKGIRRQWTFLHTVRADSWVRFDQVPLGKGYRRFRVVYGSDKEAPRHLEVRLDSLDGPVAGTVELLRTDRARGPKVQIYSEAVAVISTEATGTRDVFIVFRSDDGKKVGEFEYFRFEQYRGEIALQKNEVKLELRTGSPNGEKIGEFYPRFTGVSPVSREMVAVLEPVSGKKPLFARVRSAVDGPIGAIRAFRLEKAHAPIDWTGVGDPPLIRDGVPVFPAPTNRPCARPGDKYPVRSASGITRPSPVLGAIRLETDPVVDGRIDEWTAIAPATPIDESWDGSKATVPPSEAWVGYDNEAFTVAVNNPVAKASALTVADHTWGATDGMEIVLQSGFGKESGPILNLYGWPDGHVTVPDIAGTPADVVARLEEAITYRAAVGTDSWSCEWRIPFAACGFTPATAPLLRFNLGVRKIQSGGWAIWCGTGGPTYVAERGGLLAFPAEFAASAPVPRENLAVWLDAADAETVQTDEAGFVTLWRDKSGKGGDARQDNLDHRPKYLPAGLNGRPALAFDEKRATRMELPDLSQEKITGTVLAVISNPEPPSEVNHDVRIFTASDGKEYDYLIGIAATVPGMQTGGPRQVTHAFSDRWAKKVRVGCFSPNYQTYFTGPIAEILVYTGKLTPEQRDRIRVYLALKWGLR
ncbi:MAG: carbohydrate-binding protein [Lentisphaerae bacterium]|jgi:hypothetical protein|nr:carbohydrate-binding protein [Lentisphaerota bacterium]MBT4822489.1 carbohydrate-binding protein [Lentisphaerota bacterium]MBT5612802.1 carbohydrate-binding protein [Lentisphaerota bacterium]MBT7057628.1 carbohydrate-binding protein [Lentisphaerota bacterium]MBT7844925.1 carbohydrate-binding protein [Lentisphaerota bacterium]